MNDIEKFLSSYQETLSQELEATEWPPEIVAHYDFESCLKHAPGKEVYLVVEKTSRTHAVLRVTSRDSGDRADAEWDILSKLDHPGIPKTYRLVITDTKSFIVREYIPGHPLDEVIARGTFSAQEVFLVTRKLCDILAYLHGQQPPVIHRDIKPQNIIMKPDGSLVLTDFGIARVFKPGADSDTQYVGTLPYAPPEQYGYAQSTPQTDIYALGIVLIYLYTGSPNRQHLNEKITNKKLLKLINRCIAFDPTGRFQDVGQIVRYLDGRSHKGLKLWGGIGAGVLALALVGWGAYTFFGLGGTGADMTISPSTSVATPSEGRLFDSSATGNLSGNISSGGFAVDGDDETYLALSDGIFVLNADGTLGRQAVAAKDAKSLNYYQGKLYYATERDLMSADPLTGRTEILRTVAVEDVFAANGKLYYENGEDHLNLYSINLDGTDLKKVSDYNAVYYRNIVGNYQYFANTSDGESLYCANLETGQSKKLFDNRAAWMSAYGDKIYFSDFTENDLYVADLDGSDITLLYNGSYSYINASPYGLVFASPDGLQLEKMALDGTKRTVLSKNKCNGICVTKNWIIYKNGNAGKALWMIRPDGSGDQPVPIV